MPDFDPRDYLKETLAQFIEQHPRHAHFDGERLDRIEYHIRRDKLMEQWDELQEKMDACDLETPDGAQRWMELQEEWDRVYNQLEQLREDYDRR